MFLELTFRSSLTTVKFLFLYPGLFILLYSGVDSRQKTNKKMTRLENSVEYILLV